MSEMLESFVYEWERIKAEPTKTGARRPFFRAPTGTLDELAVHVTTLDPGQTAHEPHRHPEEEMIILKEGTLDALLNGKTSRMGPGSIFFIAPNDLHGVRNVGQASQATYYVIRWYPPGMSNGAK